MTGAEEPAPESSVQLKARRVEEDQQRDNEGEDAESFGQRHADEEVGLLGLGSRRVAQGADIVVAEQDAEADTGADHAEGRQASADVLEAASDEGCRLNVHGVFNSEFWKRDR